MGKQSMIQTIADENFEYESLDEFIEKRGMHPFKFEIIAAFGDPLQQNYYKIGLEFKAARVALYGHGSQTSLYHQIKEFLASKSYWHFKVADPWIWALMFIPLLTIVGWIVSRTIGKGESTPEWPIFVLLVNILLVGFCIIYRKIGFGVSLIPAYPVAT
jgi:hypothetical protein